MESLRREHERSNTILWRLEAIVQILSEHQKDYHSFRENGLPSKWMGKIITRTKKRINRLSRLYEHQNK